MENSLCDDYITEKFFTILQEYNTVKSNLPTLHWWFFWWPGTWVKLCSAILCELLYHPAAPNLDCQQHITLLVKIVQSISITIPQGCLRVSKLTISLEVWLWWWWVWTKCAPSVPSTTPACSSVTNRGKANLVASLTLSMAGYNVKTSLGLLVLSPCAIV